MCGSVCEHVGVGEGGLTYQMYQTNSLWISLNSKTVTDWIDTHTHTHTHTPFLLRGDLTRLTSNSHDDIGPFKESLSKRKNIDGRFPTKKKKPPLLPILREEMK